MEIQHWLVALTLTLISLNCRPNNYKGDKTESPSRKYYFITTVNRTDKSKQDYADLILNLYNSNGEFLSALNTNASDFSKWVVDWEKRNDTIILNSSDIGILAWRIENGKLQRIELNADLKNQAAELKQEKYN